MRMYDIIQKKRNNEPLTDEEIIFAVNGFVSEEIPDYQMSALLMAICFNGMNDSELAVLTKAMIDSGDTIDLSEFGSCTADKHSTGGVGDKTTLIVAPIVASLGVKIPKMSGRGLGFTGGTLDKLESIPGFKTALEPQEFSKQVNEIGLAVISQTANITPADKKLYALRDVTATIDCIPLIASSIMSKKLAAGSENIVLDVTVGSGSFMKSEEEAQLLSQKMIDIGKSFDRNVVAVLTNMDSPLGYNIGNALEVIEAVETLKGNGPVDIVDVAVMLAAQMISLALGWRIDESMNRASLALESGEAFETFKTWIERQGGDISFIDNYELLGTPNVKYEYKAQQSGFISHMNAEMIGKASAALGAGRARKEDTIDYTAGIKLLKKTSQKCKKGDTIAILYTSDETKIVAACEFLDNAIQYEGAPPLEIPHILGIVR